MLSTWHARLYIIGYILGPYTLCHTLLIIYSLPHSICLTSSGLWHLQLSKYLNKASGYVYESIILYESVFEHVESTRQGAYHRVHLRVYLWMYLKVYVRVYCGVNSNEIQRYTLKGTSWRTMVYCKSFLWSVQSTRLQVYNPVQLAA